MTDLDSSFELLSTMSPKFKGAKSFKKRYESPHKLSLKSNIRRSAVFDKAPHSHHVRDSSIIILDDSVISEKLSPTKVKIIKAPIIISSTSESEKSDCEDVKPYVNVQPKFIDIDTWLSDNEKLDGYSEIYSFKHNSFSGSDDEKLNCTIAEKKTKDDSQPSGTWQVVDIESNLGKEHLRTPMPNKEKDSLQNSNNSEDLVINSSVNSECEKNIFAENILDDLYGTSWRLNKNSILSNSEPRNKPPNRSPIRMGKTERKPKNMQKLDFKSTWSHRHCDSNSETSASTGKKLSFSDSEDDSDINYKMTPPTSVGRTDSKKSKKYNSKSSFNSSRSSNEINFSESDNDSLGTKVRKKLAKKAKSLSTDTSNKQKIKPDTEKKKFISKNKTDKTKTNATSSAISTKISKFDINTEKFSFIKSLSGGVPPWKCHPEALIFKTNFKTQKVALAKKLFDLYNEHIFGNVIPDDTPLQWNERMRGTAGFCYNRKATKRDGTVTRSCRIALATKILDTADRLRDTLVHEMCHAATWLINNVADGHGPYWKSWAAKAMQTYPELPAIKRCHEYQINTKYTYKCMDCGYSIGRHSKSLDIERKRCGYCYGKFEIFINKVKKNGEKQTAPATPKGKVSAFALYVKENYGLVKSNELKHGDVMKILGQNFAKLKIIPNV